MSHSFELNSAQMQNLKTLGWNPHFQVLWELANGIEATWLPARVIDERPSLYTVIDCNGNEHLGELSGKWKHEACDRQDLPSVGDWVLIEPRPSSGRATLKRLLERKTCLTRKMAGGTSEAQVIAANIDTALIVASLNSDLNLRRLERYLAVVLASGAKPMILLSKSDLCADLDSQIQSVRSIAGEADVIACSAFAEGGLEDLRKVLRSGDSFVVIGSSGVGKSTLVNRLAGREVFATGGIREDDEKGRHTTTSRHLLVLESGAILIDTPGMRELGLWNAEEGLESAFEDIAVIARRCRFTDCRHQGEPGCAVAAAMNQGEIDAERIESHRKLQKELAYQTRRVDKAEAQREKQKWKSITQSLRARLKEKGRK